MLWKTTRVWALLGLFGVAALAGCDGGGSSDDDEMTVTVQIDGVAKGELHAGESLAVRVPSGAEVIMQSSVYSTWTATDPEGSMTPHRSEPQYRSDTLWSLTGAEAVMKIANAAAPAKVVTVIFEVDRATFQSVPAQEGDTFSTQVVREYNGQTIDYRATISNMADDGSREEAIESLYNGTYYLDNRSYYDAEDRLLKFFIEDAGLTCSYEPSYAKVSFPLFVGKSWSSDTYFDGCHGDTAMEDLIETRTVQGFERVSTPAGEFDSLRIVGEGRFTIYDLENREGTQSETCWWSVTLGRFVKCEMAVTYLDEPDRVYRTNTVLTDFHR